MLIKKQLIVLLNIDESVFLSKKKKFLPEYLVPPMLDDCSQLPVGTYSSLRRGDKPHVKEDNYYI